MSQPGLSQLPTHANFEVMQKFSASKVGLSELEMFNQGQVWMHRLRTRTLFVGQLNLIAISRGELILDYDWLLQSPDHMEKWLPVIDQILFHERIQLGSYGFQAHVDGSALMCSKEDDVVMLFCPPHHESCQIVKGLKAAAHI